mgnify:CR=1 FL=1
MAFALCRHQDIPYITNVSSALMKEDDVSISTFVILNEMVDSCPILYVLLKNEMSSSAKRDISECVSYCDKQAVLQSVTPDGHCSR